MENIWIIQNSDNDLVTSCFTRIWIGITRSLLLCFGLFTSSDTFTGCSGVVVKDLNMSKTCQTPRASKSPAEVSEYVLRLKYEFFSSEHRKECFKGFPPFLPNFIVSINIKDVLGNIVKVGGYNKGLLGPTRIHTRMDSSIMTFYIKSGLLIIYEENYVLFCKQ